MSHRTTAERNAEIVRLHVDEGLNLTEVGDVFGLTGERVRQIVVGAGQTTLTRKRYQEKREARAAAQAARAAERAARPYPHGTRYGYMRGCSCDDCRGANRAYGKSLLGRPAPSHGLSGYQNYGCRCDVCRAAQSTHNLFWRKVREARAAA